MNPLGLGLIALAIILYGLVSGRLQKSIITPPMAFALFGLFLGPLVLNIFHFEIESEFIKILAEVTLVLILFSDASRIHLRTLRSNFQIPTRMLLIGLPLTLVIGSGVAWMLFGEFMFWEAALLAALLAPTDAALGQAVVSNPKVPVRMRQALNVESGLNDGLALPFVLFLLEMANIEPAMHTLSHWLGFIFQQVLLGIGMGVLLGFAGGKLIEKASRSGAMNHVFMEISSIALAVSCFAFAELVGGNGFIAAFIGGLTLGNVSKVACECLYEFAEAEGQLLTLITFLVYGSGMVIFAVHQPDMNWPIVILFSLLSLTLIRMIPISLSLVGMKLKVQSHLYLGWFGPRGIASILFGLIVLEETGIVHREEIFAIVMTTVFFSIFAHGLTAWPFANAYADNLASAGETEIMPEHEDVPDIQLRYPFIG